MRICPGCNATDLPEAAKVCGHCGTRLPVDSEAVGARVQTTTVDPAPVSTAVEVHAIRAREGHPGPRRQAWAGLLGVASAVGVVFSGTLEWFRTTSFADSTGFALEWTVPFQGDPRSVQTVSVGLVLVFLGLLGVIGAVKRSDFVVLIGLGAIVTGGAFIYSFTFETVPRPGFVTAYAIGAGPWASLGVGFGLVVAGLAFAREGR